MRMQQPPRLPSLPSFAGQGPCSCPARPEELCRAGPEELCRAGPTPRARASGKLTRTMVPGASRLQPGCDAPSAAPAGREELA